MYIMKFQEESYVMVGIQVKSSLNQISNLAIHFHSENSAGNN
jgi:hypothetical protein